MGLMQSAVETYDAMNGLVGVIQEGKEPLAPVGHLCTRAAIEITITKEGRFVSAQKVEQKIIIPVTEESAGRTSRPAAHPLCEQIGYLIGEDKRKTELYLNQLAEWKDTIPNESLEAVYSYVSGGTIRDDLLELNFLSVENGSVKNDKDLICWRIVGLDHGESAVWTDRKLHSEFIEYYLKKKETDGEQVSMISGNREAPASQHLKGVVALAGNAKLISSNDTTNFTYLGRFLSSEEALSVGYLDSQKAHNALKWVIANQGVMVGKREFVCWNPEGIEVQDPLGALLGRSEQGREPGEYKRDLFLTVMGMKNNLKNRKVVIASFEAATSGRLAVTYFNEFQGSDYLDRLQFWDETFCWNDGWSGTWSPGLKEIVRFAFGVQRGNDDNAKVEVDEQILGMQIQRLLLCRTEKAVFPSDIERALVNKCFNPLSYNARNRRRLQFITCAAIRKYRLDRFKEDWEMALEPERKDRSYQYGRLLAVMEKAERDTYDSDEKREPYAIRLQSIFTRRPAYATRTIVEQLKTAYYPKLSIGQRTYYEKLIGEILTIISNLEADEYNKPLSETYLLGYYLQKNAFYTKKTTKNEEDK